MPKLLKTNIMDLVVSQGIMNEFEAISMIRQGRVRVDNRTYFDPKHGCHVKAGTPFRIDKHEFRYYPHLYLMYNKPQHVVCNTPDLPSSFLHRKGLTLRPIFTIAPIMSGLTVYSDDPLLIAHVQRNRDLMANMTHVFEVQFKHQENDSSLATLKSPQMEQMLRQGLQITATKNKNRVKTVNIDRMQLMDENIKDANGTRMSKWRITMSAYPKSLHRLLRSVQLEPCSIHRVSIAQHLTLSSLQCNEWQIMHRQQIQCLANYENEKSTHIAMNAAMSSRTYPVL